MTPLLVQVLLAAIVGGHLAVERKAFLQAALSRPLVASALIGLAFGQLGAGLLVGAPLELLFLGSANLGAAQADHETLAALAVASAAAVAARALHGTSVPAAAVALLALAPMGIVGRALDRVDNRVHQHFADAAMALVERGEYRRALRMNWRSLWFPWVLGAAAVGVGAAVGAQLGHGLQRATPHMDRALTCAFLFASAVCAAHAVRGARHPRGVDIAVGVMAVSLVAALATGVA